MRVFFSSTEPDQHAFLACHIFALVVSGAGARNLRASRACDPARQAGKNPNRGIGFEIGAAIDKGDVRLGVGDINAETRRQRGPARSLNRDETLVMVEHDMRVVFDLLRWRRMRC